MTSMEDFEDLEEQEELIEPESLSERAARSPIWGLDGEASPQTQAIAEAMGAAGFALNRWWVLTPVWWSCPSCKRIKPEIARVNHRGEMMGEMHAHHDHIGDFIMRRFHEVSGSRHDTTVNKDSKLFLHRAVRLVSAFDETVICADCNSADAKAKRAVGTHPDFSFSPQEIEQFVKASSNRDHRIDVEKARSIWQDSQPAFNTRLRFIERLVELAVCGGHWFQSAPSGLCHPASIEGIAKVFIKRAGYDADSSLSDYIRGARSIRNPVKDVSAWRMNCHSKPVKVPTAGQIDHLMKVTHARCWKMVPDDWTCPCCDRTKKELVKPSADLPWSLVIRGKHFSQQGDPVFICDDCNHARMGLIKEADVDQTCVFIQDIRDIVIPAPHSKHCFRDDAVVGHVIDRVRLREPAPSSRSA